MSADPFLKVQRDLQDAVVPRRSHPKGWEPGVDTAKGTLTVQAGDTPPSDWSNIIRELGLDPAQWTVDESQPCQVRTWDVGTPPTRMYYYRATVIPSRDSVASPDIDALIREVKKRKPVKHAPSTESRALVVCLSDWQAGKGASDNTGVDQLLSRLFALKDAVPKRVNQLKRAGTPVDTICVLSMGDLSEGCDGHYAAQTSQVELDYREQARLVRRMLVEMLSEWVKLAPNMQVACVPANHGERRKNGKMFTQWGDNTDVEAFEVVREVLAQNPAVFGHIGWVVPDQEQTVSIDVCGTIVGIVHGHQFRSGAGPQGKALNWWKNMAMNRTAIGDADVLVSGHFHHLQLHAEGVADSPKGRTWMQCPALDCGSEWWEHMGGAPTQQGTLTFTADANGWDNLKVLR